MIEKIICWIIAIIILLLSLLGTLDTGSLPLVLTAVGLLFIPGIYKFFEEIVFDEPISRWLRYPALSIMFIVGLIYYDSGSSYSNSSSSSYSHDEDERCSFCYGEGKSNCTTCNGQGKINCRECNGMGRERVYFPNENENGLKYLTHKGHSTYVQVLNHYADFPCDKCNQSGKIKCTNYSCNGTGKVDCSYCGGDGKR